MRPVTPVALLADGLGRLVERTAGAEATLPGVHDELRRLHALAAGLDPYLEACTTPASPALAALAEHTLEVDWTAGPGEPAAVEAEMLSGHVEGQLLQVLVRAVGATRVLEIGMFTGYAALAMAEAVPSSGRVVACEIDPAVAAVARAQLDASPAGARVEVRLGPALETLGELAAAGEVFDLVFLDADKPRYLDYFLAVLDGGLLAPDGLLCVDNTLMQGAAYLPDGSGHGPVIAAFNDAVARDPRVVQVLVPLRDGVTLVQHAPPEAD